MQKAASFITLPYTHDYDLGVFKEEDNRFPSSLVRHFIENYTKKGDRIFDPFMGFGTTAFAAEKTGRVPFGIEADRKRFEWCAGQLENWQNIIWDDAANMPAHNWPKMDFAITSPPYMPKHHKWNPLYGGAPDKAGYDVYLKRMAFIFKQLSKIMKRNASIIVQVDNLHHKPAYYTPLVRDISLAVEKSMPLKDEIIVKWKNPRPDYPYTHCLLFKNA